LAGRQWRAAVDEHARAIVERHRIPGVAVGVSRRGRRLLGKGYGHRDREAGHEVTENTVFGIGSVTKSFTAMAVLQLEEDGKLSVHDPVRKHLPEFKVADPRGTDRITIHHFLTHTSGLPPLPTLMYAMVESLKRDPSAGAFTRGTDLDKFPPVNTYQQLLDFIASADVRLLGPPGLYFSYSNDAYALLGAIIERAGGRPYEEFLRERILGPLGMTSSTFDLDVLEELPDVAVLYAPREEAGNEEIVRAPVWWESRAMAAAGFLKSTVADLLRYLEVYRNGGRVGKERILSPASVARMLTPYVECQPGAYYGYGLVVQPSYHGYSLVEHGGGIKGVSAYVSFVPERGVTGAALANLAGVPSGQLLLAAINGALGLPVTTPRQPRREYTYPLSVLEEYVGAYSSQEVAALSRLTFGLEDGKPVMTMGGKPLKAWPAGPDLFQAVLKHDQDEPGSFRFLRDTEGRVYAVSAGFRILRREEEKGRG